jgi:hypothetical protein
MIIINNQSTEMGRHCNDKQKQQQKKKKKKEKNWSGNVRGS